MWAPSADGRPSERRVRATTSTSSFGKPRTRSPTSIDETTADFLKWMYFNGQSADQFSPVARYRDADYSTFRDEKQAQGCAGLRRTGNQRRGGYDWIIGAVLCAPAGRNLTNDQFTQFIDGVRLQ